jgi:seryl-tRNA synthetase
MIKIKSIIVLSFIFLITGCQNQKMTTLKKQDTKNIKIKTFKEKPLKVSKKDVFTELKYVNKQINNSTKQIKVLNEKVNLISKKDHNTKELKNRVDEHEKVLMTLMNDVINLSKGQQNLQKSDQVIYEQMDKILNKKTKIAIELKKDNEKKEEVEVTKKDIKKEPISVLSLKNFKASTFELLDDSEVFVKPNGTVLDKWEKGTRFTSYISHGNWVKATGVIENKRWKKISDDYWINTSKLKKLR